MLIAYCVIAFVFGIGVAAMVAAWTWPEPGGMITDVRQPLDLDAEFDTSCLRTLELRKQIEARDKWLGNVQTEHAPHTTSSGPTWHYIRIVKPICVPSRLSSCSAPSQRPPQRDSRGRFCSRRRGAARDSQ